MEKKDLKKKINSLLDDAIYKVSSDIIKVRRFDLIADIEELISYLHNVLLESRSIFVNLYGIYELILEYNKEHNTDFNLNIPGLLTIEGLIGKDKKVKFLNNEDIDFYVILKENGSILPRLIYKGIKDDDGLYAEFFYSTNLYKLTIVQLSNIYELLSLYKEMFEEALRSGYLYDTLNWIIRTKISQLIG